MKKKVNSKVTPTSRRIRTNEIVGDLLIRRVPRQLRQAFHSHCVLRDRHMREVIIRFMHCCVKNLPLSIVFQEDDYQEAMEEQT